MEYRGFGTPARIAKRAFLTSDTGKASTFRTTSRNRTMGITNITVRGARQHNLKNISVEIPRNTLTVITGLSGSGKSSLAFDTRSEERRVGKECRSRWSP